MISQSPIPAARDLTVQQAASPVPSMRSTVQGWFRPLVLVRLVTTLVDRESNQVEKKTSCMGAIQPFTNRMLEMKSEGERTWNWVMLHTTADINLNVGEKFTIGPTPYRVMGQKGFSDYGFIYYELIEDYRTNV